MKFSYILVEKSKKKRKLYQELRRKTKGENIIKNEKIIITTDIVCLIIFLVLFITAMIKLSPILSSIIRWKSKYVVGVKVLCSTSVCTRDPIQEKTNILTYF